MNDDKSHLLYLEYNCYVWAIFIVTEGENLRS